MKISTALKMVLLVLAVTLAVIFFLQNRGPVRVALPFERSFQFGLIYLLALSYVLGIVSMGGLTLALNSKSKKKRKLQEQHEAEELLDEE